MVDALALFAKRLFLVSAAISVLATLALPSDRFARRGAEYHFALLSSLLGMLVLASARDLILLFVAFELMSIPLYFLTGFQKKETRRGRARSSSSWWARSPRRSCSTASRSSSAPPASTDMGAIAVAVASGNVLAKLGLVLALAGLGFKIAAVPFHMWVPDTYEAATTPFVAWLSVAPKAAGFIVIFRLYLEGAGGAALVWVPLVAALAGPHHRGRQPDGDPADERQAHARVLRHRAHRLHADGPRRDLGLGRRDGALLPGGVSVREHGRVPRGAGGGHVGGLGSR